MDLGGRPPRAKKLEFQKQKREHTVNKTTTTLKRGKICS